MKRPMLLGCLLFVCWSCAAPNKAKTEVEQQAVAESGDVLAEPSAPTVKPGEDWLFWAEGDVFIVDGEVWWTEADLNETLAKAPPRVPARAQEMDADVARGVIDSYVAAAIRVKANKALVDRHLEQKGVEATEDEAQQWYQAVQELVAGPAERQILARFAGRDAPLVDEAGMMRAARRNAKIAALMKEAGNELPTTDDARELYDADPTRWEVPGMWTVHLVECETTEACEELRARVVDDPGQFASVAAKFDGDHGEVALRAQAGTPARPLLNAFDAREPGSLTPVVELGGSAWIAKLVEVEPAHVPGFDTIADTIVANLRIGMLNQYEDALVEKLRGAHDVRIVWDNVRFRVGDEVATLKAPATE